MHVLKLYSSKQQHKVWRSKLFASYTTYTVILNSVKQPQKERKNNMTGNGHYVLYIMGVTRILSRKKADQLTFSLLAYARNQLSRAYILFF